MKNMTKHGLMTLLVGGLLFITSCGKDDEPSIAGPSMVVNTTPSANTDGVVEVEIGTELSITVIASTPAGFNTIRLSDGTTTVEQTRNDLNLDATDVAGTATFDINISGTAGATATYTVTVVDEAGASATEDLNIELIFTGTPIAAKEVVLLAAPTDDNGSDPDGVKSSDTFYSTNLNAIYSMDDVLGSADPISADIDFGYYWGTTNEASLTSPNEYPLTDYGQAAWTKRNATLFRSSTMTATDFDAIIKEEDLAKEFEVGNGEAEIIAELTAGDIIAFKTDATKTGGSKFGLIKIVSIVGTNGSDGRINIEVLIEQ